MDLLGHHFSNFKSEELICWRCGYVIPRDYSEREVQQQMIEIDGSLIKCGGVWHVWHD